MEAGWNNALAAFKEKIMKSKQSLFPSLILFLLASFCHAQQWSGIIDPSRAIDWSNVGMPGGIPSRTTQCGPTIAPYDGTAATINTAIQNCPAGQYVHLGTGTFNLTTGIAFNYAANWPSIASPSAKSNITVRGNGSTNTIIKFTGSDRCATGADVCMAIFPIYESAATETQWGGTRATTWTAGYTKGTVQITVGSASALAVGQMIVLDQANDTSDNGGFFVCDAPNCRIEGTGNYDGRIYNGKTHSLAHLATITQINGNVLTISPGLYANSFRSNKDNGLWLPNKVVGLGIEDLTLDHTNTDSSGHSGVQMIDCYRCWIKGVRSIIGNRNHVWLWTSPGSVVRDSYFYGTKNAATQSYGVELSLTSDNLVENNIFYGISAPILASNSPGAVAGYNYSLNNVFGAPGSTWMQDSYLYHNAGQHMMLWEGNNLNAIAADNAWGTGGLGTYFRNRLTGWETGKTQQTVPIVVLFGGRGINVIGNVLGTYGYHNKYESSTSFGNTNCYTSIFNIGFSGATCGTGSTGNDPLAVSTIMRWGNYDTVTSSVRWNSSEVPTTGVPYMNGNPVPATHNLPNSFYLAAKPYWWGSGPWPAIGPDVSGGTGPGGHAYAIPAEACFSNTPVDSKYGSLNILLYNATTCYGQQAVGTPTNVRIVPY